MVRYAGVLIKKIPREVINELKRSEFRRVDVGKLVPAFMSVEKGEAMDQALGYLLEICQRGATKDKTVHNLLLYFFA